MKQLITVIAIILPVFSIMSQTTEEVLQNPQAYEFSLVEKAIEDYYIDKDKGRGTGYKQWKRWEYFMSRRLGPDAKIQNVGIKNFTEYESYKQTAAYKTLEDNSTTNGDWSFLTPNSHTTSGGWNPGIGRVNRITFENGSNTTIYVATAGGGLWKTTNSGTHWTSLTDGIPLIALQDVVVDSSNSDIIYIFTGDGESTSSNNSLVSVSPSYRTIGVLKTTNGGETWFKTDLSWDNALAATPYPRKIIMHPTNNQILFAVTDEGIYKTSNGGISWKSNKVATGDNFFDIEFKPGSPDTMYASSDDKVYRSVNTGDTWTPLTHATLTTASTTAPIPNRIELAVTYANPDVVYAVYGKPDGTLNNKFKGLFRTNDSGNTWTKQGDSPNIVGYKIDGMDDDSQTFYDLSIAVEPSNDSVVYVGGINLWKSTNAGKDWAIETHWFTTSLPANLGYVHADQHDLKISGSKIFAGCDGGIYSKSLTGAANTWADLSQGTGSNSGLQITQMYRLGGTQTDKDHVAFGAQDNGINLYDGTKQITHIGGADGMECAIDPSNKNNIFAIINQSVYRKSSAATSLTKLPTQPGGSAIWNPPLLIDPLNSSRIFYGSSNLYGSINSGSSWFNLFAGLAGKIVAMAQGTTSNKTFYVADATTMRRNNNITAGIVTPGSWTTVTPKIGTVVQPTALAPITYIAIDETDTTRLWVTLGGYVAGRKVYESTDKGATWTNISAGLPNHPVHCVVHTKETPATNRKDRLYVGTDIGVFYRDDDLGTWIPYSNGMPVVVVSELEIYYPDNLLRAATYGRGLWESPLYESCPDGLVLTDKSTSPPHVGEQNYEAKDSITSEKTTTGGLGTKVYYTAGKYVKLKAGFNAKLGIEKFNAKIESCDGGLAAKIPLSGVYAGVLPGIPIEIETPHPLQSNRNSFEVIPNISRSKSDIVFELAEGGEVLIRVADMTGKFTFKYDANVEEGGKYKIEFLTEDLPSGTYIVLLDSKNYRDTRKLIVID